MICFGISRQAKVFLQVLKFFYKYDTSFAYSKLTERSCHTTIDKLERLLKLIGQTQVESVSRTLRGMDTNSESNESQIQNLESLLDIPLI